MKYFELLIIPFSLFLFCCTPKPTHPSQTYTPDDSKGKMNVLFIAIDDLRPELGIYGTKTAITPNMDKLANDGVYFTNAFCQQAVCAPSRNSVMTGLRPDSIGIYNLGTNFRTNVPDIVTLPQHFKNNGYQTESIGKIYHIWHGNHDDTISWSINPWNPWNEPIETTSISRNDTIDLHTSRPLVGKKPIAWNASEFPESWEQDSKITDRAIERIKLHKDKNFFLGIGYLKPHLPFNAPKRFWDIHDPEKFKIPSSDLPKNAPDFAMNDDGEMTCCYHTFDTVGFPLPQDYSHSLIHGYHACVSYIDYEIGRLRQALEKEGLADNTLIVLWGDHGFKLGDYGHWCKHTNYMKDIHVPFMIYNPQNKYKEHKIDQVVELLDIYPTVCQEANLSIPKHTQGKSLTALSHGSESNKNAYAISQWPKEQLMGYSIVNKKYHYIAWLQKDKTIKAEELYDLTTDSNEKQNVAMTESYSSIKTKMNQLLFKAIQ